MITKRKLCTITGRRRYLDEALELYGFMRGGSGIVNDAGRVGEPPLTYTQGTWIEGCRLLYHITGDSKYMDDATVCMSYTMTSGRCGDTVLGAHNSGAALLEGVARMTAR